MKCVCSLFILVLVVQIVHAKKPRLTSKQNREPSVPYRTISYCMVFIFLRRYCTRYQDFCFVTDSVTLGNGIRYIDYSYIGSYH
jgi:hypothetical protein